MRRITSALFFISVLTMVTPRTLLAQITSNVFERVLEVRVNGGSTRESIATAFTLDVDGREYLITAKHVVADLHDKDKLEIFTDGGWKSLEFQIFRCEDPIDIAVLIPPYQLTVNFELPFDKAGIYFGQDAFFLGFPYGIQTTANGANGPYPMAMIKKGVFSGQVVIDKEKNAVMMLFDGYNNPGFSGGPIVFREVARNDFVYNVLAVVSGFIPEVVSAMGQHDIASPADAGQVAKLQPWRIQKRPNGTYFEYVDNGSFVALNTGIVQGYSISPAIEIIRKHPIGPETKELLNNRPKDN